MMLRSFSRLVRNAAAVATTVAGLGVASSANAFSINTDDVVGIWIDSGYEMIVNLGNASTLTPGYSKTVALPAEFGGASGGRFVALGALGPINNVNYDILYTTDPSLNPPSFATNISQFVLKIGPARDAMLTNAGLGFLGLLDNIPAPNGSTILANDSDRLVIATNLVGSYTNVLKATDRINAQLPFLVSTQFGADEQLQAEFWRTVRNSGTSSTVTLFATFDVNGGTVSIPIPEPGTAMLLFAGLAGLAVAGRRREKANI